MITFEIYEKYPSIRKSISDIDEILHSIKHQTQLEDEKFHCIRLCINEIFINAIYHGNKFDASKFVEFHSYIENNILTVSVTDQGDGFDVNDVPDPLVEKNIIKDSGRGIFIISHYADSVSFQKTKRGFNTAITFYLEKLKNNTHKSMNISTT